VNLGEYFAGTEEEMKWAMESIKKIRDGGQGRACVGVLSGERECEVEVEQRNNRWEEGKRGRRWGGVTKVGTCCQW